MFKKPKIWRVWPWISSKAFLNNVPTFRIFCFFVERNLTDSSYILWNKFQDYQLRFILTNHFLVAAWPIISRELESCLLTARQHGSYGNHINKRFSDTLECTVIVIQWKRKLKMASWAKWFLSYNYLISDDCIPLWKDNHLQHLIKTFFMQQHDFLCRVLIE